MYEKKGGGESRYGLPFDPNSFTLPALPFHHSFQWFFSLFPFDPYFSSYLPISRTRCYDFFAFRASAGEWPRFTSFGIFFLLKIVTRMSENDMLETWSLNGGLEMVAFQSKRRYLVAISYETVTFLTFLREFVSNDFSRNLF